MSTYFEWVKTRLGHSLHDTGQKNKRSGLPDEEFVCAACYLFELAVNELFHCVAVTGTLTTHGLAFVQFRPGSPYYVSAAAHDQLYVDKRILSLSPCTDDELFWIRALLEHQAVTKWYTAHCLLGDTKAADIKAASLDRIWTERRLFPALPDASRDELKHACDEYSAAAKKGVGLWDTDRAKTYRDLVATKRIPMPIELHDAIADLSEDDAKDLRAFLEQSLGHFTRIASFLANPAILGVRGINQDTQSKRLTFHLPRGFWGS